MTMNKKAEREGVCFSNISGHMAQVIEYENAKCVLVRFLETGYECIAPWGDIQEGSVRDRFAIKCSGIGYLGGDTKAKGVTRKRLHLAWRGMLRRLKKRPEYADVTVDESWLCFQQFADDAMELPGFEMLERGDPDIALDKDIRVPGARRYSKDTCQWVTRSENSKEMNQRRGAEIIAKRKEAALKRRERKVTVKVEEISW